MTGLAKSLGGAFLVVLLGGLAPIARASGGGSDESVPRVVLRAGGERQVGRLWSSGDAEAAGGNSCSFGHGDGIPSPAKRGLERRGDPFLGKLVIERDEEPRVRLDAYTELDEYGTLDFSSGQRVRWNVRPRPGRDMPRQWVVTFRTAARDHVYLDLAASWQDPSGCGRDSASYVFHLERAS